MVFAIRSVTVERGLDPREFVLFSYGGGGGLFAAAVADELELPTVVVPRAPANFSAWGILTSDYREDAASTRVTALEPATAAETVGRLAEVADSAGEQLAHYGFGGDSIEVLHRVDVRYAGQDHTLTIPVESEWLGDRDALLAGVRERFVAAHSQLYGHGTLERPLEVVTCRARSVGRVARPPLAELALEADGEPSATRSVFFRGHGRLATPVYDRAAVRRLEGPAIVEEWTTTIVVPPAWSARSDRLGNLILEHG
jgi:N-methylhydantoinase A